MRRRLALPLIALLFAPTAARAQLFTPLTLDPDPTSSFSAGWLDYDSDGDLDVFVTVFDFDSTATENRLFRNDGGDTFTRIQGVELTDFYAGSIGVVVADADNDGDDDLYVTEGGPPPTVSLNSSLWENVGGGQLDRVLSGDIDGENTIYGNGAAWGDIDNDGWLDLVVATTIEAYPPPLDSLALPNVFFRGNGDGTFTRDETVAFVSGSTDTYVCPRWSDRDLDGDLDLAITASRRDGTLATDYFWTNQLVETGTATFTPDVTSPWATVARDGEETAFVDYDNDGDLDLFITNAGINFSTFPPTGAGMANELWRNDGGGGWTQITTGTIVNDTDISIGQSWGDFDNDADLDLIVYSATSVENFTGRNRYYRNDGPPDYTFRRVGPLVVGDLVSGPRVVQAGGSVADYDDDGDLDVFVPFVDGTGAALPDRLYRNETNAGGAWVTVRCEGVQSNRSAIGAKVRALATVQGNPTWQLREITGATGLTGSRDLRAHFGLAGATTIDSLRIDWPSGAVDVYTDVPAGVHYRAVEGETLAPVSAVDAPSLAPADEPSMLHGARPSPFRGSTRVEFTLPTGGEISLRVFDAAGREIRTLAEGRRTAGSGGVVWDGRDGAGRSVAAGVYYVRLTAADRTETRSVLLLR